MAIAFASNVLLYALLEPTTAKGETAVELLERAAMVDAVIPAQVLGELLAVVRRRRPELLDLAMATIGDFTVSFQISSIDGDVVGRACSLAIRHRLQVWDAVVCAAAIKSGATHLLTEDMQDGAVLDGLRMIDPFMLANRAEIDELLPPLG